MRTQVLSNEITGPEI